MKIPIQNLYFLLAYAWQLLPESRSAAAGIDRCEVPEDLFALVLRNALRHQIRRGIDRGYQSCTEEAAGVRGRIAISPSIKSGALNRGRLVCVFDELSLDVLHNRLIRGTLVLLVRSPKLEEGLKSDLHDLLRYFELVASIDIRPELFRRVQLHTNVRAYSFILSTCELIARQMLPTPDGMGFQFEDLPDSALDRVFELFVRNFYAREQSRFSIVKVEFFDWKDIRGAHEDLAWLPRMKTDVSLISPERRLIIETKFYSVPFATSPHDDKQRVRSGHLYQLFAYLRNSSTGKGSATEGLLLYAEPGEEKTIRLKAHGHPLTVATVDLSRTPTLIASRLAELIEPSSKFLYDSTTA